MNPIQKELSTEKETPFHAAIKQHVKQLVDFSRKKMSSYYDTWDCNDATYRALMPVDKADVAARNRKEPTKMVVPIAHSQMQTFVAFCYSLYTQRENFFELLGMSPEDTQSARFAEAALQRDLDHNKFTLSLYQFLLDIGRFGIGVQKVSWVEDTQFVPQTVPAKTLSFLGMSMTVKSEKQTMVERIKFQGNKVITISPYRFFPDVRLPISRFQEGEFVASEDEMSYSDLQMLQHNQTIFGLDYVTSITKAANADRISSRLNTVDFTDNAEGVAQSKGTILITEVQVKLIPSKFQIDGQPMGPEDYPVKYLVWIANDQRVVRCEPLNYIHDEFTYVLAEYTPDMNHFLNPGLLDLIDQLQSTISWMINSHITSVRKVIQNFLIVDPDAIEMDDLVQRKPVIRTKPGISRNGGVEKWIKQLQVQDVTQNHLSDADLLQRLIQVVTGINDNLLGQFHSGRRSATEARQVNASTASRLKMVAAIIFTSALEPLGRQMLSNLRDGLTEQTFVRMFGTDADLSSYTSLKQIDRNNLAGDYDFQVFDGTLPSEKTYQAGILKEVLLELMSNPMENIQLFNLNPQKLLFEAFRLQGIRHPQRFAMQPDMGMEQLLQQFKANGNQIPITNQPATTTAPTNQPLAIGTTPPAPAVVGQPGNGLIDGIVK